MSKNLFQLAISRSNDRRPPVWFMRQAGRYHSHYQNLRKKYSFIELCKIPEVACEATMGPIRDFNFDAAILFSDLLFPLEVMGMGLKYEEGPKLDWHIRSVQDVSKLSSGENLAEKLLFQSDAIRLIRKELPQEKGLLGFVGGPLTLFFYAVEGSHQGELCSAQSGLEDGRFDLFSERLLPLLAKNMAQQAMAGIDTIAVLDTCAGEVSLDHYRSRVIPKLKELFKLFHQHCPDFPITYYSKGTSQEYWRELESLPISAIGVDWNHDLSEVLDRFSDRFAIQGNIDPQWLFLEPRVLEEKLSTVFEKVKRLPSKKRSGWICGLGHGVLPKTPEENVRLYLKLQKKFFGEQE